MSQETAATLNNLQKKLLEMFLKKYESSKAYTHQTEGSRRIIIKINPSVLKSLKLDLEDSQDKEQLYLSVKTLNKLGFIDYSWVKYEENNLLKELWLNVAEIESIYQALNQKAKISLNDEIAVLLRASEFIYYKWMNSFKEEALKRFESHKDFTGFLPKEPEAARDFIILCQYLDELKGESIYERVLSTRLFKDSKYFSKQLRTRFFTLIRKFAEFDSLDLSDCEDEELLDALGILKHPEMLEFCGPVQLKTNTALIDCKDFPHGAVINAHTADSIEHVHNLGVHRVLFIENKANYEHYIAHQRKPDELVIYHGGWYSSRRGKFFRKLIEHLGTAEVSYDHWSDIDLGGINLFMRLKQALCPELKPFKMDVETLEANKAWWISMEAGYKAKLEKKLEDPSYEPFHRLMTFMVLHDCRLEQESLL